ncbi:MAG TPA: hypothetical protein VGF59_14160 [Bryobacteraceae bacterium]
MNSSLRLPLLATALLLTGALAQNSKDWQSTFPVDRTRLGVNGANQYFNLTPGYQLSYKDGNTTDTLTVLDQTKLIDGVETRPVEDREMKNGQLIELTLDYYAVDSATNDLYYFGEDVDVYRNGKVVGHEGAWLSGVNGAKFGLMMPGQPKLGRRFYQELAPGIGMDRVEIASTTETIVTPAGTFQNCIHTVETSPLEKGLKDHKWYAPGVGQVKDGKLVLVKYGMK